MDAERFVTAWSGAGGSALRARHLFAEVFERYAEPGRHYHTPGHITHCLCQLESVAHLFEDRWGAELAIWFHDVIYVTGSKNNERDSARYFLECSGGQLDNARRRRIARHILATRHPSNPRDPDSRLLVDVDLSSFAIPWARFLRDTVNVRRETAVTATALEYARRQHQFLQTLSANSHIFLSQYFRSNFEASARDNIQRLMDLLVARQSDADT